jgi:hypothetical protein
MVQNALLYFFSRRLEESGLPSTAVIREGPYGVPLLKSAV